MTLRPSACFLATDAAPRDVVAAPGVEDRFPERGGPRALLKLRAPARVRSALPLPQRPDDEPAPPSSRASAICAAHIPPSIPLRGERSAPSARSPGSV